MTPDAIEKEILIDAPVETVYRVITEPSQISQWFSDTAELDPVPGGEGTLVFDDWATSQLAVVRLTVQAAEPPQRFCFRWDYPDGEQPHEGNSLLVEFALTAEGGGTRLRVTESGFTALRGSAQEKYDAHNKGWDVHLASLQRHVAGQS
ncbi:MAG TPA: SRPBCC family protein [Streptosporangiaceae bacterium]|nr:SRPBCC family protein [Streptosporangiaceae bacterium]